MPEKYLEIPIILQYLTQYCIISLTSNIAIEIMQLPLITIYTYHFFIQQFGSKAATLIQVSLRNPQTTSIQLTLTGPKWPPPYF